MATCLWKRDTLCVAAIRLAREFDHESRFSRSLDFFHRVARIYLVVPLFKRLHRVCIRIIYQKRSSIFYTKLNIRWRLLFRRVTIDCSFENDTERFFLTYWCLSRRSTGKISQSKSICINVFTWNRFHWPAKLAQPLETSILYEHTQFPYDPSKRTFGYIKFILHRYSVSHESLFQVRRHLWILACSLGYTVKSFLQNL